jgi:hypothetical protein
MTELGRILRWTAHTGLLPSESSLGIEGPHNQVKTTDVDDVLAVFIENLRASTVTPVIDSTWESLEDLPLL